LFLPYGDHIVVHLLQLLLGHIERVWRRVELVCLKGLVGETDLKGLVILLKTISHLLGVGQQHQMMKMIVMVGQVGCAHLRHVLPLCVR
jgi:hypothetical protein